MAVPVNGKSKPAGKAETYKWATADRIIIISMALYFVIAISVDIINAIAPVGGITPEQAKTWKWPPQPIFPLYFWWCEICDPVLLLNPLWCKYLCILSPFVFAPFYLIAIPAIINRRAWIRIPIIIFSSVLTLILSIYFVEAVWGVIPSPNVAIFAAGYGYYLVFPLFLIYRFWHDDPFQNQHVKQQ